MPERIWIPSTIADEAKKHATRSEFQKSSVGAYSAARRLGILDDVCAHMKRNKIKRMNHWTEDRLIAEAKKYKTRKAFYENNVSAYARASQLGILDKVCSHMTYQKRPRGYWTKSRVKKIAKRYTNRKDFMKNHSGAYGAAQRDGYFHEIIDHMRKTSFEQMREAS